MDEIKRFDSVWNTLFQTMANSIQDPNANAFSPSHPLPILLTQHIADEASANINKSIHSKFDDFLTHELTKHQILKQEYSMIESLCTNSIHTVLFQKASSETAGQQQILQVERKLRDLIYELIGEFEKCKIRIERRGEYLLHDSEVNKVHTIWRLRWERFSFALIYKLSSSIFPIDRNSSRSCFISSTILCPIKDHEQINMITKKLKQKLSLKKFTINSILCFEKHLKNLSTASSSSKSRVTHRHLIASNSMEFSSFLSTLSSWASKGIIGNHSNQLLSEHEAKRNQQVHTPHSFEERNEREKIDFKLKSPLSSTTIEYLHPPSFYPIIWDQVFDLSTPGKFSTSSLDPSLSSPTTVKKHIAEHSARLFNDHLYLCLEERMYFQSSIFIGSDNTREKKGSVGGEEEVMFGSPTSSLVLDLLQLLYCTTTDQTQDIFPFPSATTPPHSLLPTHALFVTNQSLSYHRDSSFVAQQLATLSVAMKHKKEKDGLSGVFEVEDIRKKYPKRVFRMLKYFPDIIQVQTLSGLTLHFAPASLVNLPETSTFHDLSPYSSEDFKECCSICPHPDLLHKLASSTPTASSSRPSLSSSSFEDPPHPSLPSTSRIELSTTPKLDRFYCLVFDSHQSLSFPPFPPSSTHTMPPPSSPSTLIQQSIHERGFLLLLIPLHEICMIELLHSTLWPTLYKSQQLNHSMPTSTTSMRYLKEKEGWGLASLLPDQPRHRIFLPTPNPQNTHHLEKQQHQLFYFQHKYILFSDENLLNDKTSNSNSNTTPYAYNISSDQLLSTPRLPTQDDNNETIPNITSTNKVCYYLIQIFEEDGIEGGNGTLGGLRPCDCQNESLSRLHKSEEAFLSELLQLRIHLSTSPSTSTSNSFNLNHSPLQRMFQIRTTTPPSSSSNVSSHFTEILVVPSNRQPFIPSNPITSSSSSSSSTSTQTSKQTWDPQLLSSLCRWRACLCDEENAKHSIIDSGSSNVSLSISPISVKPRNDISSFLTSEFPDPSSNSQKYSSTTFSDQDQSSLPTSLSQRYSSNHSQFHHHHLCLYHQHIYQFMEDSLSNKKKISSHLQSVTSNQIFDVNKFLPKKFPPNLQTNNEELNQEVQNTNMKSGINSNKKDDDFILLKAASSLLTELKEGKLKSIMNTFLKKSTNELTTKQRLTAMHQQIQSIHSNHSSNPMTSPASFSYYSGSMIDNSNEDNYDILESHPQPSLSHIDPLSSPLRGNLKHRNLNRSDSNTNTNSSSISTSTHSSAFSRRKQINLSLLRIGEALSRLKFPPSPSWMIWKEKEKSTFILDDLQDNLNLWVRISQLEKDIISEIQQLSILQIFPSNELAVIRKEQKAFKEQQESRLVEAMKNHLSSYDHPFQEELKSLASLELLVSQRKLDLLSNKRRDEEEVRAAQMRKLAASRLKLQQQQQQQQQNKRDPLSFGF